MMILSSYSTTISTVSTTIAVATQTTSTHVTTTTTTNNNNNNKTYFIKLRGRSQGDPMEGFPQYSGGKRRR
jgi:hypothetical protein